MPVLEFSLDADALYRVQVHFSANQGPVSIMLNRNVLGLLATSEQQRAGKDFRLFDNSTLHVRMIDGQPQVWRDGNLLPLAEASAREAQSTRTAHGNLERGVMTWIVVNLVVMSGLTILYAILLFSSLMMGEPYQAYLAFSIAGVCGFVGVCALLAWRRWGFYLAVCCAVATIAIAVVYSQMDYRAVIPVVSLGLLYYSLRASGLWKKMS